MYFLKLNKDQETIFETIAPTITGLTKAPGLFNVLNPDKNTVK
jgi:hypothetical protein